MRRRSANSRRSTWKSTPSTQTFDELIIPALRLAESDFRDGVLTESTRAEMHQLVQELIESLGEEDTPKSPEERGRPGGPQSRSERGGSPRRLLPAFL